MLGEFHIWPGGNRRLFAGIDRFDTPVSDIAGELAIEAGSWETRQTISLDVSLAAGTKTVRLAFTNDFWDEVENIDRNLNVDRMVIRDCTGAIVTTVEFESFDRQPCGEAEGQSYKMWSRCSLEVPVEVLLDGVHGVYTVAVEAHQDRGGDELPFWR